MKQCISTRKKAGEMNAAVGWSDPDSEGQGRNPGELKPQLGHEALEGASGMKSREAVFR